MGTYDVQSMGTLERPRETSLDTISSFAESSSLANQPQLKCLHGQLIKIIIMK